MWAKRAVAVAQQLRCRAVGMKSADNRIVAAATHRPWATAAATRFYSPTSICLKNTDEEEENLEIRIPGEPEVQTIGYDNMSPDEIEKILEQEEARMAAEQKTKYVDNWVPGMRKRPTVTSHTLERFEYELEPDKHPTPKWRTSQKRCGALALKVGMIPVFDDWGVRHGCTMLLIDKNIVIGHKTMEKHGYRALQVAAGERKRKNVGKCVLHQYKHFLDMDGKEDPPYLTREFRITDDNMYIPIHHKIHAYHFVPGQCVDIAGITKGKGFQGAMKKHHFKGMPASHGVSLSHRALGSTGQCQDPGRVFKGKKMAGQMGGERRTTQNLRVLKIDRGRNLLYIVGSVPGNKGQYVEVRDAIKLPGWNTKHVLGNLDRPPVPTYPNFDPTIDGCGKPDHVVFMPLTDEDPLSTEEDPTAAAA